VADGKGETVGMITADKIQYVTWCGIISRHEARLLGGRGVKLKVARIDHHDLADDEYMLGCYVHNGVYGVVDAGLVK